MAKRSLLFLSPEPPYPVVGGGPLRTASLIEYLARSFEIDLAVFAVDGASDPAEAVPPSLIRRIIKLPLPSHSKSLPVRIVRNSLRLWRGVPPLLDRFSGRQRTLREALGNTRYDIGWVEHFWCAPYAEVLGESCRHLVLDLHNIESEWHERAAVADAWPLSVGHKRFAERYRSLESTWMARFHTVLVTSARDAQQLGNPRAVVYPNAIPTVPHSSAQRGNSIVFSGNLEYHPNQQAVRFFHRHVWPLVKQSNPDLQWRIVGKNPNGVYDIVRGDSMVHLTGSVTDAITELSKSRVAIVPVLAGSGTRVKILEAWAAGLAVVSTTLGAEGLDAVSGHHLLLADTPGEFAASIIKLLEVESLRKQLASAGRTLYEEKHTWDAAWRILDQEIFLRT